MLSWRVHAQAFTIACIIGGAYMSIRAERNWIFSEADKRNIRINKSDFGIKTSRLYERFVAKFKD